MCVYNLPKKKEKKRKKKKRIKLPPRGRGPSRFLTFSPLFTLLQNYITPVPEGYAIAICNLHSSPKGAMS
ncbi:hypothetical protein ACN38_g6573 [Penicillium nordicum]|uniref:Uncharacterized protein n=1 Tax=Penicillium nordicum TaxID=229535 RepID=A0A0M9WF72_9EURO|nr:hypothetical protein ACN38_g6573 [Penicillium nordicum]